MYKRQRLLLGRVALVAQRLIVVKLSYGRSVGLSVCPVHCGKTADRIRMPFGIIDRIGPGMRQVVGSGDRSTGRGTFGGEFGVRHCNQYAALFPNYFGQTCLYCSRSARRFCWIKIKTISTQWMILRKDCTRRSASVMHSQFNL